MRSEGVIVVHGGMPRGVSIAQLDGIERGHETLMQDEVCNEAIVICSV
jgi:hypothetical protein